MLKKIKQFFRLKKFKNVKVKNSHINKNTYFERYNSINNNCKISNCYLGKYSYIGTDCIIRDTKIGNFCSLGNNIKTILGSHPINFISTHNFCFENFSTFDTEKKIKNSVYKIIIENDVWIGDNVLILSGVTIHTGAIIGAGALVNRDIPPYAIVGGIPAKVIKYRFSNDIIQDLMNSKWWELSIKELNNYSSYFNTPKIFLEKFNN